MLIEKNRNVIFWDQGLADYQKTWSLQEQLLKDIVAVKVDNRKTERPIPTKNYLLFCQHPHVYTIGKSGDISNLLLSSDQLAEHKAKFYKINRGGDITYHGPGQLVGYPILDLENFFTDIHLYLRTIERAVIRALADLGVDGGRIDGLTGVWVDYKNTFGSNPRKICAIGVKTSRWVTMHGFALNVNTDLSYFDHIVPCGIEDKAVTSLAVELGKNQDFKMVSDCLKGHLSNEFNMMLTPYN